MLRRAAFSPVARIGLEKLAAGAPVGALSDEELDALVDSAPLDGPNVRTISDADLEALVAGGAQRLPAAASAALALSKTPH